MATSVLPEASRTCETHAAPASRASWCGQLKLGTLCVPVKAYAAIATPPEIPLRQLHALCGERIEYQKCCPKHGEVPAEEIVKGYPYQPDQYVRLTEEELASLQPADEKTLHLEHFLEPAGVDLVLLAGRILRLGRSGRHWARSLPHNPLRTSRGPLGPLHRPQYDLRRRRRRLDGPPIHPLAPWPARGPGYLAQPSGRGVDRLLKVRLDSKAQRVVFWTEGGMSMTDASPSGGPSTSHLRRRTPGSFLLVPCPRQGRSIRCQGQLEGAAAVILAACPRVVHIQEQPLTIWYTWRGTEGPGEIQLLEGPPTSPRKREKGAGTSYIVPDFLVEMADGRKRLVEVKPSHRLARPIVQRKLAVGRAFAAQEGWTFHVVTEKELFHGPLLDNVRLLNRYRQGRMDPSVLEQLVLQVPPARMRLSELLSGGEAAQHAYLKTHVFHLLAKGRLSFNPCQQALDDSTLISPGGTIAWDPFESVWAPSGSATDAPTGSSAS